MRNQHRQIVQQALLFTLALAISSLTVAQDQSNPLIRQETILAPDAHPGAARTHHIFHQLLKLWTGPRLEPSLRVIDNPGIWAVSLADGVILISRGAVELALAGDSKQADVQLAFVLAHEIAHQRADHVSQQAFSGRIAPDGGKTSSWSPTANEEREQQAMEHQADAEGLLIAALAGYDPLLLLGENDFFTVWVERVRATPCTDSDTTGTNTDSCDQARRRAQLAREYLEKLAGQTLFFELGIQAFVAGSYELARYYFEAFGRVAPSAAVHTNIGLTHLAEALNLGRLSPNNATGQYAFQYPMLLSNLPFSSPRRGIKTEAPPNRQARIAELLDAALTAFERALQLNPADLQCYNHQIVVYLVQGNVAMARGLLDGKVIPRFGKTPVVSLLNGILLASEGALSSARKEFITARNAALAAAHGWTSKEDQIAYAAGRNLELLSNRQQTSKESASSYPSFIQAAQHEGRELLVRMATPIEKTERPPPVSIHRITSTRGIVVNKKIADLISRHSPRQQVSLPVLHQTFTALRYNDGLGVLVDQQQRALAAWQEFSENTPPSITDIAQALSTFGTPDRQVVTEAGVYWSYDDPQYALRIVDNRVVSIFQYPSERPIINGPQ